MPHCLSFVGKVRQVLFLKAWKTNAVMKRENSNCVGILSDREEAAAASNLSQYTTRNSFPRYAPGATTQGDSAIKVWEAKHQEFYLEQYS